MSGDKYTTASVSVNDREIREVVVFAAFDPANCSQSPQLSLRNEVDTHHVAMHLAQGCIFSYFSYFCWGSVVRDIAYRLLDELLLS